ncbi:MAG: flagellar hook-basal body protein [Clostridia bacterium]|nr:flagellar hook-basal body protein [Clostridia bacterium]
MIRGLYTSGWSLMANSKKLDVISNNLANASTNAYKKDTVVFESFPNVLTRRLNDTMSKLNPSGIAGEMQLGSDVGEIYTYYTQGQLQKTNNNLDMSLKNSDNAFFTIGVPGQNGEMREYFTRDGAFVLNSNNQLVTKDGYPVLGENGPITLEGSEFSVTNDGIVVQNGEAVDRLRIREFTDLKTLRKHGSNLVGRTDQTEEREFSGVVVQGQLEQSNVNVVREMIDMISVMRLYESSQKLLQMQDGTLEKTVNEVGAVR